MIRWNIAAYTGIIGFGLSFLVGLFSGNPFLIILFRAIIFAVVFAGIGAAASYLLNRFTPEIFNPDYKSATDRETNENIDIVLPEENPVIGGSLLEDTEDMDETESAEEAEATEELGGDEENYDSMDESPAFDRGDEESDSISEEVTADEYRNNISQDDEIMTGREASAMESAETAAAEAPEGKEIPADTEGSEIPAFTQDAAESAAEGTVEGNMEDTAQSTAEGIMESTGENPAETTGNEELDELPDMGVLENSFMVLKNDEPGEDSNFPQVSSKIGDSLNKKHDPQVYAQAVRTIIKRDEEGPKKHGR
ncbi:MAG: hypothetical protein P8107_12205 [Spirochaetia bacterium]